MDINNAKDKIIEIKGLCGAIISLSNLYNNEETGFYVDYDKIIDSLESIIRLQFKRE